MSDLSSQPELPAIASPLEPLVQKLSSAEARLNSVSTQLVKLGLELQKSLEQVAEIAGALETTKNELTEAENRFHADRQQQWEAAKNQFEEQTQAAQAEFDQKRQDLESEFEAFRQKQDAERARIQAEWAEEAQKREQERQAAEQQVAAAQNTLQQMQQMLSQFSNVFGGATPVAAPAMAPAPAPEISPPEPEPIPESEPEPTPEPAPEPEPEVQEDDFDLALPEIVSLPETAPSESGGDEDDFDLAPAVQVVAPAEDDDFELADEFLQNLATPISTEFNEIEEK